jgi:hypothetical protein
MVTASTVPTKGDTMSTNLIATTPTRPPAFRDQVDSGIDTDHADRAREPKRSRLWTLIEALAYAGAIVDPSGILAVQRLRQAQEEERNGHR